MWNYALVMSICVGTVRMNPPRQFLHFLRLCYLAVTININHPQRMTLLTKLAESTWNIIYIVVQINSTFLHLPAFCACYFGVKAHGTEQHCHLRRVSTSRLVYGVWPTWHMHKHSNQKDRARSRHTFKLCTLIILFKLWQTY